MRSSVSDAKSGALIKRAVAAVAISARWDNRVFILLLLLKSGSYGNVEKCL